jgi:adenylate kinase family enzyme
MRVAIIGNSGSGKSTLAQRLARHTTPVLDLDEVAWEPGLLAVRRPLEAARDDVRRFCGGHESWVVEGCYGDLVSAALEFGPELLFLNPGEETCLQYCRRRRWEPHKYANPIEQEAQLAALLEWVSGYYRRDGDLSLRGHRQLFEAYSGPKREVTDARDPQPPAP